MIKGMGTHLEQSTELQHYYKAEEDEDTKMEIEENIMGLKKHKQVLKEELGLS